MAENLLQQNFTAVTPNQVWVGDITYIQTDEGWLYLAVVMDLWSRKVVGWSMSERMTARLVCDALRMALFKRKRPRGVIMHADRGSQYCSREHRAVLKVYGLIASMSAKGNCYDNAAMQRWNHSLKVEAVHGERFTAREQAKAHVFEYIEVDYNRTQLHSTPGLSQSRRVRAVQSRLDKCPKFGGKISYRLSDDAGFFDQLLLGNALCWLLL